MRYCAAAAMADSIFRPVNMRQTVAVLPKINCEDVIPFVAAILPEVFRDEAPNPPAA